MEIRRGVRSLACVAFFALLSSPAFATNIDVTWSFEFQVDFTYGGATFLTGGGTFSFDTSALGPGGTVAISSPYTVTTSLESISGVLSAGFVFDPGGPGGLSFDSFYYLPTIHLPCPTNQTCSASGGVASIPIIELQFNNALGQVTWFELGAPLPFSFGAGDPISFTYVPEPTVACLLGGALGLAPILRRRAGRRGGAA